MSDSFSNPTNDSELVLLDDENFAKIVNPSDISLVMFCASWCGPCGLLLPVVLSLKKKMESEESDSDKIKVKFFKFDLTAYKTSSITASSNSVKALPTILLFFNNAVVAQKVGLCGLEDLQAWIESEKQEILNAEK